MSNYIFEIVEYSYTLRNISKVLFGDVLYRPQYKNISLASGIINSKSKYSYKGTKRIRSPT